MAFLGGPDSPGIGIRFFPAFKSADTPPIQDNQENDWFAGAMQCFAPLALAATVSANTLAAQLGQQAATWDQGDVAYGPTIESLGTLLVQPQQPLVTLHYFGGQPDEVPRIQATDDDPPPLALTWNQWFPHTFLDDDALPHLQGEDDVFPSALVWPSAVPPTVFAADADFVAPPTVTMVDEDGFLPSAIWLTAAPGLVALEEDVPPQIDDDTGCRPFQVRQETRIVLLSGDGCYTTSTASLPPDEDWWLPVVVWPTPTPRLPLWAELDAVPSIPPPIVDDDTRSPLAVIRSALQIKVVAGDGCYTTATAQTGPGIDEEPLGRNTQPREEPTVLFGPWSFAVSDDVGVDFAEEDAAPVALWMPTPRGATLFQPLPVPWQPDELPVQALAEEFYWQPSVFSPVPPTRLALWDAGEAAFLPPPLAEEEYWQNWVAPKGMQLWGPLPVQFGHDDLFPGPAVRALDDGATWTNYVPHQPRTLRVPNPAFYAQHDNHLIFIGWGPLNGVATVPWGTGSIGTQNPWLPLSAVSSINSNDTWGVDYRLAATEVAPAAISDTTWRTPRTFSSQYTTPP